MFPIALLAALAAGALAQTTTIVPPVGSPVVIVSASSESSITTIDTTIDPTITPAPDARPAIMVPAVGIMDSGYAASIKKADACSTVLILGCDKASTPNDVCGFNSDFKATMTMRPNDYDLQFSTKLEGDQLTLDEQCHIGTGLPFDNSPVATCTYSGSGFGPLSDVEYYYDQVKIPITEGAKKLPAADATCTSAAPAGILQIKKLLVSLVLIAGTQALL